MHSERIDIDVSLVRRLVEAQFPQWAGLPITPAEPMGWDNYTYRLGNDMKVRLPSAARYAAQVEKEHRWLPRLAQLLPLPIPTPLAIGNATDEYPWPWSISHWIDGDSASTGHIDDLSQFAVDLAQFLNALQDIDATGGPQAGQHNFFRGGPLTVYDAEVRNAVAVLEGKIDDSGVMAVWENALEATWTGVMAVWVHGDVSPGNLLVKEGQLSAVIDFGGLGVGDPACDLAIAWTFFSGNSRDLFRKVLQVDSSTWTRGCGWALWKALISAAGSSSVDSAEANRHFSVIDDILANGPLS